MREAELVVAVNTDEMAPIYDIAHFGTAVDALTLLLVLIEKIKATKGD